MPSQSEAGVVFVRLHGDLRFFWAEESRGLPVRDAPSLKHVLEGAGIPHPEVDWVRVDGEPAELTAAVRAGSVVDVGSAVRRVCEGEAWRFVLDCHLGRLVKHLRLLGFDVVYERRAEDAWLAEVSANERRWLFTRDKGLLFRSAVERGYLVRSPQPRDQLAEVLRRHDCRDTAKPLSRCLECNAVLFVEELAKGLAEAPPKTRIWCREYWRCPGCGRLYWKGSHYDRLISAVNDLLS